MKWLDKKHVMIDLETLAQTTDATILSIGACTFYLNGLGIQDKFYVNVDPKTCKDLGMRVDPSTIEWWAKQDKKALAAFKNPPPINIEDALDQFDAWYNADYIWCRGMFDVPILDLTYHKLGRKQPYKYWQALDHRTMTEIMDVDFRAISQASDDYHNALGDAVRQAEVLIKLFEKEAF